MMRVSDPIIFGHLVLVYYEEVFAKHGAALAEVGVDPDNGVAELITKIRDLPEAKRAEIEADIQAVYEARPELFMVELKPGHHEPARAQRYDH